VQDDNRDHYVFCDLHLLNCNDADLSFPSVSMASSSGSDSMSLADALVIADSLTDAQLIKWCRSENSKLCPVDFLQIYGQSHTLLSSMQQIAVSQLIVGSKIDTTIVQCLRYLGFSEDVYQQPRPFQIDDLHQKAKEICQQHIISDDPALFWARSDVHRMLFRLSKRIHEAYGAIVSFLDKHLQIWAQGPLPEDYVLLYQQCKFVIEVITEPSSSFIKAQKFTAGLIFGVESNVRSLRLPVRKQPSYMVRGNLRAKDIIRNKFKDLFMLYHPDRLKASHPHAELLSPDICAGLKMAHELLLEEIDSWDPVISAPVNDAFDNIEATSLVNLKERSANVYASDAVLVSCVCSDTICLGRGQDISGAMHLAPIDSSTNGCIFRVSNYQQESSAGSKCASESRLTFTSISCFDIEAVGLGFPINTSIKLLVFRNWSEYVSKIIYNKNVAKWKRCQLVLYTPPLQGAGKQDIVGVSGVMPLALVDSSIGRAISLVYINTWSTRNVLLKNVIRFYPVCDMKSVMWASTVTYNNLRSMVARCYARQIRLQKKAVRRVGAINEHMLRDPSWQNEREFRMEELVDRDGTAQEVIAEVLLDPMNPSHVEGGRLVSLWKRYKKDMTSKAWAGYSELSAVIDIFSVNIIVWELLPPNALTPNRTVRQISPLRYPGGSSKTLHLLLVKKKHYEITGQIGPIHAIVL